MSTLAAPTDAEADPRVAAVFADIRETRGGDFVNLFWRHLAAQPALLEEVWGEVKRVMAAPSALDPKVKEMLYAAVSIANGCEYCAHSHTAAAKARGMTDEEHGDLLRVVGLAAKTNALADAIRPGIDPEFRA